MSISSCVTGMGRHRAGARSLTMSKFLRNMVLIRMSRIMTMGNFISSSRLGAGGAITDVCCIVMGGCLCVVRVKGAVT